MKDNMYMNINFFIKSSNIILKIKLKTVNIKKYENYFNVIVIRKNIS